jgi:hypothetical protein
MSSSGVRIILHLLDIDNLQLSLGLGLSVILSVLAASSRWTCVNFSGANSSTNVFKAVLPPQQTSKCYVQNQTTLVAAFGLVSPSITFIMIMVVARSADMMCFFLPITYHHAANNYQL